jgi:hypothetical protein
MSVMLSVCQQQICSWSKCTLCCMGNDNFWRLNEQKDIYSKMSIPCHSYCQMTVIFSLQLSIHQFSKVTLTPQSWPGACLPHKHVLDLLRNNLHWSWLMVLWAKIEVSQSLCKFKTNFWGLPARMTVSRGAMKQYRHGTSTWNKWDSRTIGTTFWRNLWGHSNSTCLLVMSA